MRQAGRYLPEYQALRSQHSLLEMFFTPQIAADVTLMPIRRYGFDAAILFADITSIAPALGFSLSFQEGPRVDPVATPSNWRSLKQNLSLLDPIAESAMKVKEAFQGPLIGFCGGPYTIATYLTGDQNEAWMKLDPEGFDDFLGWIAEMCIHSLKRQIAAGADAVQIFDSWADQLQGQDFERWSLRWIRKIAHAVSKPVIVFMRGSAERHGLLASIGQVAISLDGGQKVKEVRKSVLNPLQGNLDPDLLFQPVDVVRRAVRELLDEMKGDPAFIVNLAHGVKPGTPLEAVAALVDEVITG